jgi:hypothetical protein
VGGGSRRSERRHTEPSLSSFMSPTPSDARMGGGAGLGVDHGVRSANWDGSPSRWGSSERDRKGLVASRPAASKEVTMLIRPSNNH